MKLHYAGKIEKMEDGSYKVVANWNENIFVQSNSLAKAKEKFYYEVEEHGVDTSEVNLEMHFS